MAYGDEGPGLEDGHEYSRICNRTGGSGMGGGSGGGSAFGCITKYTAGAAAFEASTGSPLAYAESKYPAGESG
jgi:hypothetical protein